MVPPPEIIVLPDATPEPHSPPALSRESAPLTNLSELLPAVEEPAIYFRFKTANAGTADAKPTEWLKRRIDQAPPLLGNVGKQFEYRFDLGLDKSHSIIAAEGSPGLTDGIGLFVSLDNGDIVIKGIPAVGFDGNLHFSFASLYRRKDGEKYDKPMFMAPDPKTLWKNLPVRDYDGYPHADEEARAVIMPGDGRLILAASCRGRSHAHSAKPRDDHFAIDCDPDSGWNLVAVADGAGSAKYSRKGAQIACETVIGSLRTSFAGPEGLAGRSGRGLLFPEGWKDRFKEGFGVPGGEWEKELRSAIPFDSIFYNAVDSSYKAILDEAIKREARIRDYHTTLLAAAFKKFPVGYLFVSYWLGDGGMAVYDWNRRDCVFVLGSPDGGEFAGQTRFLTMREEITQDAVQKRLRFCFADDFGAFIQMTDGIADPFFPGGKDVESPDLWRRFWNVSLRQGEDGNPGCPEMFDSAVVPEEKAKALRKWLDFWSKGNHDDRTILIVQ
jgi:hypothetical protein